MKSSMLLSYYICESAATLLHKFTSTQYENLIHLFGSDREHRLHGSIKL
jgi:hypothetical protein